MRHGSDVSHQRFDDLDVALDAVGRLVEAIRAEGPLEPASMLRDFAPADQIHARLQISGKGLLRRPTAGIDVRGDGSVAAYRGGVRREELDTAQAPVEAIREALTGERR